MLVIAGATEHNLKDVFVRIPLGMLVCVTGVSGSGKSTWWRTLCIEPLVDFAWNPSHGAFQGHQRHRAPQGHPFDRSTADRTHPRSNPITYLKAFDEIRQLFASERDALRQRFTPGHFSFNAAGGRCERCEGSGVEKLEMYFSEDIYAPCEICEGRRFKPEVLKIRHRGKNTPKSST